jgi:stearoyl-CoA desaturase (delta-9 desaturase)
VIIWVADHRRHHAYSDREGDPHSPWRYGNDARALLKGMFHAHLGWLFDRRKTNAERYAPDLLKDAALVRTSRMFVVWSFISLVLPGVIGGLVTGSWFGAWTALFWAGLVRIGLLHHVTWSINSVCHFFGRRRFEVEDQSTNVFWLALPSFGESWHHNHHAFPRSAVHGLKWWEVDPSAVVIRAMKRVKLAWNVVEISPERQAQKAAPKRAPVAV